MQRRTIWLKSSPSFPASNSVSTSPFFNEFVIDSEIPADEISTALKDAGIVSGLVLADGGMLWCATEMTTKEDIDYLIEMLNIMFFEQDGENETDGGTEA